MPPRYEVWTFFGQKMEEEQEIHRPANCSDEEYRITAHEWAFRLRNIGNTAGRGVHTIVVDVGSVSDDFSSRDHSCITMNTDGSPRQPRRSIVE